MPVNTASAAIHITPVVIKTFLEHYRRKTQQTVKYVAAQGGDYEEHANDELMFDEAFHIVKAFIELGTQNSIESLQAFTNTYIPAPYWVAVAPVLIPFKTCNRAADVLIDWFGPDDLVKVVGGERWWQVRGLDGLEGEWVTEKSFLSEFPKEQGKKQPTDTLVTQMEHLEPVMLYVHGGGYFFGSINTHRFQIIRYAKKLKGRAFTVNYRKAPQYPWPCPLHDVLSAYFYLIDPPPDSPHKPVSPSKIVLAGDSAGGALCLTALTVLRDMGIPLPAGAVLISPWVDLTHSFPSVMSNTKTDIIPNGGFVYKPSTLWPIQPYADADHPRVRETKTSPPPQPGHADTLNPGPERIQEQRELPKAAEQDWSPLQEAHMRKGSELPVKPQKEMQRESPSGNSSRENQAPLKCEQRSSESGPGDSANEADVGSWEPKPPKVLMEDPDAVPLELLSQIQQYATNEQLTHPLVSPVLQGSLCNLPPLYIIAGNNEALRDEIVYLAHRAAHPTDYPVRSGVLKDSRRQRENIEKFTTPTKVHLQVCDDMPHVLTVFTFIESATYAYRSIAQFARHVTGHSAEHIARNPFPEFHRPECRSHMDKKLLQHDMGADSVHGGGCCGCGPFHKQKTKLEDLEEDIAGVDRFVANERTAAREVETQGVDALPGKASEAIDAMKANGGDLHAQTEDIPHILMIRERVNIHGRVRPMEPPEDIIALQIRPGEIGIIKEAPVRRWHTAQETVDRKFEKSARRIAKNRRRIEERVARMLKEAREEGLILVQDSADLREEFASRRDRNTSGSSGTKVDADADHQDGDGAGLSRSKQKKTVRVASAESLVSAHTVSSSVRIDEHRRYGPLDLDDEHPPPSAIAGRRDTLEALALIKKHVYHTAPATHLTVPKLTAGSTIRAAFDPWDKASAKPNQSVSERQVRTSINPMHGLKIWNSLLSYFSRKAVTAAGDAVNSITARVDDATDAIVNTRSDPGRVQTRSHDQSQQP